MLKRLLRINSLCFGLTSTLTEEGLTLTFPLFSPKGEEALYSLTITAEGEVISDPPPEGPFLWLSPKRDFSLLLILASPIDAFIVEALCPEVKAIAGVNPEATLTALEAWRPLLLPLFRKAQGVYFWNSEALAFFVERVSALYQIPLFIVGEDLASDFSTPFKILKARDFKVARDFLYYLLNKARPYPSNFLVPSPLFFIFPWEIH